METGVDLTMVSLGRAVAEAREQAAHAREEASEAKKRQEQAEQALLDVMEAQGVKSAKVPGVGLLTATTKTSASYTLDHLEEVMAWLRGMGHGDVIRPHVPAPTFTSMVKEAMEAGVVVPDFVKVYQEINLSFRREG